MERLYLILDSQGTPMAQAVLDSPPGSEVVQMHLLQDDGVDYTKIGQVQLIGLDNTLPSRRGVVTMQRGERLVIRPGESLGAQARENLRIQTDFESVMYPAAGCFWKGQRPIKGHDLSCGGLAIHTQQSLKPNQTVQVVLPVTDSPMLLKLRILRQLPTEEPWPLYAGRFVDLCLDEEVMIRKAVFSIQVSRPHAKAEVHP